MSWLNWIEQTSVKSKSKYNYFHTWKWILAILCAILSPSQYVNVIMRDPVSHMPTSNPHSDPVTSLLYLSRCVVFQCSWVAMTTYKLLVACSVVISCWYCHMAPWIIYLHFISFLKNKIAKVVEKSFPEVDKDLHDLEKILSMQIFIWENAYISVTCKMSAIFFRPWCGNLGES